MHLAIITAILSGLVSGDLSVFRFQIHFVTYHHEGHVVSVRSRSLRQKLVSPGIEVGEGAELGDVVDEDAAVGSSVEGVAQRLEPLLPRSIPNLQSSRGVLKLHIFG